jgi:large subunit ribosomal protein L25
MPQVPLKIHARQQVSLKVQPREEKGKGPVGQMRRLQGQLPGIIYGHKQAAESFKTDAHSLEGILGKGGQNAIIVIEHEESDKESEQALIRDIQYHKVRGDAMHLDLLRIDPSETLRANVPIVTVGVPEGVRTEGGSLQQTLTSLEMECVVSEMPSSIEIDISS